MTDPKAPIDADDLEQIGEVLADIVEAIHVAVATRRHAGALNQGFQHAYGLRDALRRPLLPGAPSIEARVISTLLTALADRFSLTDEPESAIGCTFVSILTELEACPADHPRRARVDELLAQAASVLALVGPVPTAVLNGAGGDGLGPIVRH